MNQSANEGPEVSSITLKELSSTLLRKWKIVAAATISTGAAALTAALLITPIYRAEVLLAPVQQSGGGALSAATGQLGGLAALSNINLGSSSTTEEAIATAQSQVLTEGFITEHGLLPKLFSSQWNVEKGAWRSQDQKKIPTAWDGAILFSKKIRHVEQDRKTGLIILSIDWKDPNEAAQWANELVAKTNFVLQQREISRAERDIAYVQERLKNVNAVEVRDALFRIMETDLKNLVLAQGAQEFSLKVIDPAEAPRRSSYPQKSLFLLLGLAGGFLISCFAILMNYDPKRI